MEIVNSSMDFEKHSAKEKHLLARQRISWYNGPMQNSGEVSPEKES